MERNYIFSWFQSEFFDDNNDFILQEKQYGEFRKKHQKELSERTNQKEQVRKKKSERKKTGRKNNKKNQKEKTGRNNNNEIRQNRQKWKTIRKTERNISKKTQ